MVNAVALCTAQYPKEFFPYWINCISQFSIQCQCSGNWKIYPITGDGPLKKKYSIKACSLPQPNQVIFVLKPNQTKHSYTRVIWKALLSGCTSLENTCYSFHCGGSHKQCILS